LFGPEKTVRSFSTTVRRSPGRITSSIDRLGRQREFHYDAANRLTTQIWLNASGTPTQTFTYSFDANSNQLTAGNSVGTYTLLHDALNRATGVQDVWAQRLTFSYDGVGNRTLVQDSQGGTATSVYDAANNLATWLYGGASQTPLRIDLAYNADNQVQNLTRSSDLGGTATVAYTTYLYDAAGRITSLIHRKGSDNSNIANYTYTYDAGSRLKTEVRNGTTTSYVYDVTNQLTADGVKTFTYDGTGNRTNTGYTTGSGNELTTDGTWNYTYDAEGNLTKKVAIAGGLTWKYGYDNADELTQAQQWSSDPDLGKATLQKEVDYQYDAYGNRVEKDYYPTGTGNPTVTRFAVDGWDPATMAQATGNAAFAVWADLDGTNHLQTRYVRGDAVDQLFARVGSDGTAYWELTDRLGSVREVTDNSGVLKDALTYDGFGNITAETGSGFRGRYAWTGREFDAECIGSARTGTWPSRA
jgi:YD repeat-containing protein